jgi:hypothetical protein
MYSAQAYLMPDEPERPVRRMAFPDRDPDLREALLRYFGERGAVSTRRLGNWLVSREGRIVEGRKFARFGTAHGGLTKWGVAMVSGVEMVGPVGLSPLDEGNCHSGTVS